jgi:uncharacterized protein
MVRKLRIGCDCDGTTLDFHGRVIKFLKDRYNQSIKLEDIKRDDCYDILGRFFPRVWKLGQFYRDTNGLLDYNPVEGAPEVLNELASQGHIPFIVTSRFWRFAKNTRKNLDQHYGEGLFEQTVFSEFLSSSSRILKPAKYEWHRADVVIEDCAYVASSLARRGKVEKIILLSRPWNERPTPNGVVRVDDWYEARRVIQQMS